MPGPTRFTPPASLDDARHQLVRVRLEIDEIDAQLRYRERAQAAIPDPTYREWNRKALTAMRHRVSMIRALVAWVHEKHEDAGSIEIRKLLEGAYAALRGTRPDREILNLIEVYMDRVREAARRE
jgi:hypothetical protein